MSDQTPESSNVTHSSQETASQTNSQLPDCVQAIKNDRRKALYAEQDVPTQNLNTDRIGTPRTEIRFLGWSHSVPKYEKVATRTSGFPLGTDTQETVSEQQVVVWVEEHNPDVIRRKD